MWCSGDTPRLGYWSSLKSGAHWVINYMQRMLSGALSVWMDETESQEQEHTVSEDGLFC